MEPNESIRTITQLAFGLMVFFFHALCFAQIGPFFATEALSKGSSVLMIGVAMGSLEVTGLFASFLPVLLENGSSKRLFCFGAMLRGVTTVCLGCTCFINDIKFFNIASIVIRSSMGIGCALVYAGGIPFLVSLEPRRAAIISGSIGAVDAVGSIVGPPIGSLLYSSGGFLLPFVVTGSSLFLFSLPGFLIIRNQDIQTQSMSTPILNSGPSEDNSSKPKNDNAKSFKKFITNVNILISALPYFVACSIIGYFEVSLAPYLEKSFAIHGDTVGYYILIYPISIAMTCAITGKLSEAGHGSIFHAAATLLATICFFLSFLPALVPALVTLETALPLLALFGVSYAVPSVTTLLVCEKVALIEKFDNLAQTKKFIASLWVLTYSSGRLFGSFVIGGVVLSAVEFYWTNLVLCVVSMIVAILIILTQAKLLLFRKVFYDQQVLTCD